MKSSLAERVKRDEWSLGIVRQPIEDIVRHGIRTTVEWFPSNPWRILADPFCIVNQDHSVTILAELLNHWIGKGEIWAATLAPGQDPAKAVFKPWVAAPVHLSYPVYIQDGTTRYAMFESFEAGCLYLWCCAGPGDWRCERILLPRPAVDATICHYERRWWLFCTFADARPDEQLHLFHAESLLGHWTAHPMNPIKQDKANARPAGALFQVDGKLIRPAQDSSNTYGGQLVLNHVTSLTTDKYREHPLRVIAPQSPYYKDGIHTISSAGDYTVVDGKRWHRGWSNLACRLSAKAFKRRRLQRSLNPSPWRFEGTDTPTCENTA